MANSKEEKDKIIDIANYLIKKSQEDPSKTLDALKLQKLLYYCKVWGMVLKNKEIFSDEFQAWVHGPANYKVWKKFNDFDFSKPHPEYLKLKFDEIDESEKEVVDMVWNVYGKFDGKYLEALTHNEEPWINARKGLSGGDASQNVITNESIKSYYGRALEEAEHSRKDN